MIHTSGDIQTRIDSGYGSLTPQEQRAADFILDHLDDLAVYSATEIAASSGVSKATVSRLFRRLGFADAQEVREQARSLRRRGVPVGPAADAAVGFAQHVAAERANLEALVAGLSDGRLDAAAALLAGAREVVVIGFRNSYPVALHLRQQLVQARPGVRVAPAPGQSVAEELADLGPRDAVVLVGFRRRPSGFVEVLAALERRQVPVILIVDPGARLPTAATTRVLTCPVDSVAAFDSYGAAMSLANLLAAAALAAAKGPARARIGGITSLYAELGELE
ncbi:rpiR family transcriptional regulator [Frondihabitans sucicola]|uniref:RpiR family transcriptional regulator n=1 Tax=Frondihabitans sucicola TaxID=1268041 RepID=A0ABM8GJA9_9MICO|nr:rpiR family transcriptional regulator [Frondihabitans sucicola]